MVVTVRRLHCFVAVVDVVDELDDDVDAVDDDVDAVDVDVDVGVAREEELVAAPGVVVVVASSSVVGVLVEGSVVDTGPTVVVVSAGATATGVSPTWESARPTICQARTVATARAATQAAVMRHEIMP